MNTTPSSQSAEQTANEQRLQEIWQKAVRYRIDEKKSSAETVAALELLGVPQEGAKMLVAEIDAKISEAKGKARNAMRKAGGEHFGLGVLLAIAGFALFALLRWIGWKEWSVWMFGFVLGGAFMMLRGLVCLVFGRDLLKWVAEAMD